MLRESQLHLPHAGFSPIYKVKYHHQKKGRTPSGVTSLLLVSQPQCEGASSRHIHSEIFFGMKNIGLCSWSVVC